MPKLVRTPSSSSQNLTNGQKQQISAHYNTQIALNPSYTPSTLADWARDAFNLSYTPSRSTISRLLNQNPAPATSPSSSRKKLSPTTEELDRLLSSDQAPRPEVPGYAQQEASTTAAACSQVDLIGPLHWQDSWQTYLGSQDRRLRSLILLHLLDHLWDMERGSTQPY